MSTILVGVEGCENGTDKRLHMKGAAEIVLGNCSHYIDENCTK